MDVRHRKFVDILIRVAVVQVLAVVVLVSALIASLGWSEVSSSRTAAETTALWQPSYSVRFPGCVASVLWPGDEVPGGFLLQRPSGALIKVSVSSVTSRQASGDWGQGRAVIGICR